MPLPSTSRLRLAPSLARSVGFFPVFFPPQGCLGHAPVHAQPLPVDALQAVVVQQPQAPHVEEDAVADPELEAVVGGGPGAELGGVQGLPLAAGAQDVEDGVQTDAVLSRGSAAAEAVGIDTLGDTDVKLLPQVVGDTPISGDGLSSHDNSSGSRQLQC
jgi:hypothetical protein